MTRERENDWERLQTESFDLVVVGGGITGAGVFRHACQKGLKVLLLDQRDFAWGTSSRSGKLVHGGMRYLAQLQLRTSLHSVQERELLLRSYPGLVNPLEIVIVPPGGSRIMKWGIAGVLAVYEGMAGRRYRRWYNAEEAGALAPGMRDLDIGAWVSLDASTDDARLVLRVIDEGRLAGGIALNYVGVRDLVRTEDGQVSGVVAVDAVTGEELKIRSRAVINATGAWADELRGRLGYRPRIRRLRGSHLVFPHHRLPIERLIGLQSPIDGRNMYVTPWEGCTLLGTTDLDHEESLDEEPRISETEAAYLLETINYWFPGAHLTAEDVISTQAGVRPVVDTGKSDPSRESREEIVWADEGLITVSGGKLTTFNLMAEKALAAARPWLGGAGSDHAEPLREVPAEAADDPVLARLWSRYAERAPEITTFAGDDPAETLSTTRFLWSELRWAASHERVVHLDDLLLRRVRVGLLLAEGGVALLPRIREEVQHLLGWDDARWQEEEARYLELWATAYGTDTVLACNQERSAVA